MINFRRNVIAAMIAVFIFGIPFWMLLDRDPPYEFENVEISPPVARQGQEINITFTINRRRPATCGPGLVYREFKEVASRRLHVYDPVLRSGPPVVSDDRKFTRIALLPPNIAPGEAVYRGISCYTCNPIQRWLRWPVCVSTPPVPFTVVEKDSP